MEKEVEKAKNVRRAAKSAFTRTMNTTQLLQDAKRPLSEIRDEYEKVKVAHADLIKRREAYTMCTVLWISKSCKKIVQHFKGS